MRAKGFDKRVQEESGLTEAHNEGICKDRQEKHA